MTLSVIASYFADDGNSQGRDSLPWVDVPTYYYVCRASIGEMGMLRNSLGSQWTMVILLENDCVHGVACVACVYVFVVYVGRLGLTHLLPLSQPLLQQRPHARNPALVFATTN